MKKLERPKCEACPKTLVVVPLLLPHHKRTRWPCCLLVEFHLLANFRDRKERRRQRRWWVLLYREREKNMIYNKRGPPCSVMYNLWWAQLEQKLKKKRRRTTNYYAHCCVILFGLSVSDGKNRLIELKMLMMGACLFYSWMSQSTCNSVLIIHSFVSSLLCGLRFRKFPFFFLQSILY